eukprot:2179461-Lingulodinium_polyedra.AAC.1
MRPRTAPRSPPVRRGWQPPARCRLRRRTRAAGAEMWFAGPPLTTAEKRAAPAIVGLRGNF